MGHIEVTMACLEGGRRSHLGWIYADYHLTNLVEKLHKSIPLMGPWRILYITVISLFQISDNLIPVNSPFHISANPIPLISLFHIPDN